jgi:hypothetical protein
MDNSEQILKDIMNVVSKYKYTPIRSGEMIRLAENEDEITIFVPTKFKNKNIVIIYT